MKREQFIMGDLLFFGGYSSAYAYYSEIENILMDVEANTIDFREHIMFLLRMSIK